MTSKIAPLIWLSFNFLINSFSSIREPLPALINKESFFNNVNFFLSKNLIVPLFSGLQQIIISATLIFLMVNKEFVLELIKSKLQLKVFK